MPEKNSEKIEQCHSYDDLKIKCLGINLTNKSRILTKKSIDWRT